MLDFLPIFRKQDLHQKSSMRRVIQHHLSSMSLGDLSYDQQPQTMALFPGAAVADHIVRRAPDGPEFFFCDPHSVV